MHPSWWISRLPSISRRMRVNYALIPYVLQREGLTASVGRPDPNRQRAGAAAVLHHSTARRLDMAATLSCPLSSGSTRPANRNRKLCDVRMRRSDCARWRRRKSDPGHTVRADSSVAPIAVQWTSLLCTPKPTAHRNPLQTSLRSGALFGRTLPAANCGGRATRSVRAAPSPASGTVICRAWLASR